MLDCAYKSFDFALLNIMDIVSDQEEFIFIEFDFLISNTHIHYSYNNFFYNCNEYSFKANHYGELNKDMECEALATVLYEMISKYILHKYSSLNGQLGSYNNDARVSLKFKIPNKKLVSSGVTI